MSYEIIMKNEMPVCITYSEEAGFMKLIPFDEANTDYQQYLIDTDGGLPLPKETK